jgi:hypothetical protein
MHDESWKNIFEEYKINRHDFNKSPFAITAKQIKISTQDFKKTSEKEVRILCKQDNREARPEVFKDNNLFLLPVTNGEYVIVKGEGYVDIPEIKNEKIYDSKLKFKLDTASVGDSEMQHLDFAYAASLIRTFVEDESLVLTIRGRKYTPTFSFKVGQHTIVTKSVQTEVDAGYEGRERVVLVEAKSSKAKDVIIRQLYYPYRQWQEHTKKSVTTLFFEKSRDNYLIWQFRFNDANDYNSIELVKSCRYKIKL